MAAIYIHIPFCIQKCNYCNFFSTTNLKQIPAYIDTLKHELSIRKNYLPDNKIDSLYIGGGTPSLLPLPIIEDLLKSINNLFDISHAEITIEANPNNIDETYLKQLYQTAVNRLSIGVQSFYDEHLQVLKRVHSAKKAEQTIELAQKVGFKNLSIDLIYGIPNMTSLQWENNLHKVKDIQHLSCYALTIEPHTLIATQIKKGILTPLDEEKIIEQIHLLLQFADNNKFRHYEISNFCKENYFSRHNYAYWQRKPYLGLGTAAHSYNITARQWNVANINKYMKYIHEIYRYPDPNKVYNNYENRLFEKEILTHTMQINEYIMTALRTDKGIDLTTMETDFSTTIKHLLLQKMTHINDQYYLIKDNHIVLTRIGLLFADNIAGNLFFENDEVNL